MHAKSCFTLIIMVSVLFLSCKGEDIPLTTEDGNGSINGVAKFLDNSIASYAKIELQSKVSGRSIYCTCDRLGNFSFTSLYKGEYSLIFRSTNYDINTSNIYINLEQDELITKDIYIKYNMLDDFVEKQINDGVFFIKFQPDGAKLNGNYDLVDYLSGYYRNSSSDNITLNGKIYKIPQKLNWNDLYFTADSIPSNFEYLFEVTEEPLKNNNHEIRIYGDNIPVIFSNPSNGFAFVVKRDSIEAKLKIPCVDFNNNDFGLKIFYK
ncbi:MAG: carboxypeptidase-like regulatory domain-containing protein [Ignavibacteriaceae bacterium]